MSRWPFEIFLALRYLRPKRTFVSVITLISIIGVMLGVAVLIIVISVMSGFDKQLRDRILGFNAHLRIVADAPFSNYEEVMARVRKNPMVKGVTPYVVGPILVRTHSRLGASQVDAPFIRGMDPRLESEVTILPESIEEGEFDVRGNGVLVGRQLARRLNLTVGDRLSIYAIRDLEAMAENYRAGTEEGILPDEFEVKGIFDVGYYEFNNLFIVMSLYNAQDLYGLEDAVPGLMVMLHDPELAPVVQRELSEELPSSFYVSTWQQENSGILDALVVEKNVMFYILFFIMIVAAFGITSALITFVVQKTREIGMLKALGATSRQVMWLFLSQSLIVGVLGVLSGLGLGMLAVWYRNEFLMLMRGLTGFELFPASIYNFSELPALIVPGDIVAICGGSLVICMLAGLLPAWNAGRLQPVEALRHE